MWLQFDETIFRIVGSYFLGWGHCRSQSSDGDPDCARLRFNAIPVGSMVIVHGAE